MATANGTQTDDARAKLADTPVASAGSKNFWTVKLVRPPGASVGLRSFVGMAEAAIQTAVDLLGRGMPTLPPKVDDLLEPAIYKTLGEGEASKAYRQAIDQVDARQAQLLQLDSKVIKSSATVAAGQNQTLHAIQAIVAALNEDLSVPVASSTSKQSARETALLEEIAAAVQRVYEKVNAIAKLNDDVASGGNESAAQAQQQAGANQPAGGGNGGGGDGGLGGLAQMLGMLPMMAMPLLQQIPELIAKQQEAAAQQQEEQQAQQQQNGQAGTPPDTIPVDPNNPAPMATAPGAAPVTPPPGAPGQAEPGKPGATPPATAASTIPGVTPASRTRTKTPSAQNDSSAQPDTDDPVDADASADEEPVAIEV